MDYQLIADSLPEHTRHEVMRSYIRQRDLAAIDFWQDEVPFHPLTCGVDSNHAELRGKPDADGDVVLVCPTCGRVQDYIPEPVTNAYRQQDQIREHNKMMASFRTGNPSV